MKELIAAAAAGTGWPESLVERSARARAQAQGVEVEAVLTAWAGGGEIAAGATPAPAATAAGDAAAAESAPVPAAVEAELAVEVLETAPAPPETEPEPEPEPDRRPSVPTWLAASFVVVPAIAIMYALFFPNGPDCGVGPQLAIDPVSGVAESCDGSDYGTESVDFFAIGEELYAGNCSACHGADGQGGGNFPALNEGAVVATFPTCDDQLEWVSLGTLGWPDATYGANATAVGSSGAQMPGFEGVLTPEELAAVVVYERVAHGGLSVAEVVPDCTPAPLAAGE